MQQFSSIKNQEIHMNAYYTQSAQQIFPIFGVSSIDEAEKFAGGKTVIETSEDVYMNIHTGSVDFSSNWESEGVDLDELTKVKFDVKFESWVEV
jgi:hypothetical protein